MRKPGVPNLADGEQAHALCDRSLTKLNPEDITVDLYSRDFGM